MENDGLRITKYEVRIMNYELQMNNIKLQIMKYELVITSVDLLNYKLPILSKRYNSLRLDNLVIHLRLLFCQTVVVGVSATLTLPFYL